MTGQCPIKNLEIMSTAMVPLQQVGPEGAAYNAAIEPATSNAPPIANSDSTSQLYFLLPKLMCFPQTLRNDFMLMVE